MNKFLFYSLIAVSILLPVYKEVQARTLEEAGLTAEDVKYLSPQELKDILNLPGVNNAGGEIIPFPSVAEASIIPGTVNCFDYYKFGSIEVNIGSKVSSTVAGIPITFSGLIHNKNTYPVVGGTLSVKIFKTSTSGEKNVDGPDVVDQFVVVKDISISGGGSVPFTFEWVIPQYAESGQYKVATFFTSADKFNLLGLSFTDDVIGNSFDFKVDGEKDAVRFDKHTVSINNESYHFAAFPPRLGKDAEAVIEVELVNSTSQVESIPVGWKLYAWDSQNSSNLINEFSQSVIVEAKGKTKVIYTVKDTQNPVYYLVAESKYKDTTSILGIRFVREGVDKTRINFPAVTEYPLLKGKEATIFSCLHSMGTAEKVDGGKLVLTLRDEKSNPIYTYEYKGPVSGEMMGVKDSFIPKRNYDRFTLSADLYQNEALVDSAVMQYDCKNIDPTSCDQNSMKWWIFATLFLLIIIAIAWLLHQRKRLPTMILPIVMIAIVGSSVLFSFTQTAEAKDVQWPTTIQGTLNYNWNRWGSGGWEKGLTDPNITVTYHAEVKNADTGEVINDGSILSVGTQIILSFISHKSEDISWFGTGYSSDSPFGEWVADAAPVAESCNEKDFVRKVFVKLNSGNFVNYDTPASGRNELDIYIPLNINPPQKEITNLGGLQCGALINNSMECTVASAGTITPQFKFNATYGKFYYRYYDFRNSLIGFINFHAGCYGNNIPMRLGKTTYTLQVPAQTISYNFTASTSIDNRIPTTPVITGPVQGSTDQSYTFSVRSTDPDLDQIKYGLDLNNDRSVDLWIPATGYVDQDVSQTFQKEWSFTGSYTFKALAQDINGGVSSWATHTITITDPVVALKPDLIASVPVTNATLKPGSILFTSTITNQGSAVAKAVQYGIKNIFQVSKSPTGANNQIGEGTSPTNYEVCIPSDIPSTGTNYASISRSIPLDADTYYMRTCADATAHLGPSDIGTGGTVTESIENNNCSDWTKVIVVTPVKPDLIAFAPFTNATLAPGLIPFTSIIKNIGTVAKAGTGIKNIFQVSKSLDINGNGTSPTNYGVSVSSDIYSTSAPLISTNIPLLDAGTYYIRACADATAAGGPSDTGATGTVTESNEANNCSSPWKKVTVTATGTLADFTLSAVNPIITINKGITTVPVDLISKLNQGSIPPASPVTFVVKIRDVTIPDNIILDIPKDNDGRYQIVTPTSGGTAIHLILNNLVKDTKLAPLDAGDYTVDITQTVTLALATGLKTALQKQTASVGELAFVNGGNKQSSKASFTLRVATTPTVTTKYPVVINTTTTATGGGTIISNGGATVTQSGIVWNTDQAWKTTPGNPHYPTTALSTITKNGTSAVVGTPFTGSMTVTAGTYHVRAYATNSVGTAYGADVTFVVTGGGDCIINCPPTIIVIPIPGTTPCVSGNIGISVSWTLVSGATSYKIFRRASGDATYPTTTNPIATITTSPYSPYFDPVTSGSTVRTYYYTVVVAGVPSDNSGASATAPAACSTAGTWIPPVCPTTCGLPASTMPYTCSKINTCGSSPAPLQCSATCVSGVSGKCPSPANHLNPCSEGSKSAIEPSSSKWTWTCGSGTGIDYCSENRTPGWVEPH